MQIRRDAAKFDPHFLNQDKKDNHFELELEKKNSNFSPEVIIGDESCCYRYDSENEESLKSVEDSQFLQTNKNMIKVRLHVKTIVVIIFDIYRIALLLGQIVDQDFPNFGA